MHSQDASGSQKQDSKDLTGSFKNTLSVCSDRLKSSETVIMVSLPITTNGLLLISMWLVYASTITFSILPLQVLCLLGNAKAVAQLPMSYLDDVMHCHDSCWRICIAGGYFSDTLEGGRMGDNLQFFRHVLGLFLVIGWFYYFIIHIPAWRAVVKVHKVGIEGWAKHFCEQHDSRDLTLRLAIMSLVVQYFHRPVVSPKDLKTANTFY
jgi:hypothetical protein